MEYVVREAHQLNIDEAADRLHVDPDQGLGRREASKRLEAVGRNELQGKGRPGLLKLLADQFNNFLIIILVTAAGVSFLVGEPIDAVAILVIVVLNAVLGVVQEAKAESALEALREMSAPEARVLRDGEIRTIEAASIVPGDVVLLESGSSVTADMRLTEAVNLRVDESSLTGESVPVQKRAEGRLEEKTPLGDRNNTAFKGTSVAFGRGKGIVTATGMKTEMGKIAEGIQSYEDEETPLQKRLSQLGKWLGTISLAVCAVIFFYGVIRDTDPRVFFREGLSAYLARFEGSVVEFFMTAVSLAIAAVPEGLPAVVTICLALGMQRMVRRHALIRKLPAVETLGTATVICTDKTGTLTQNQMTMVEGWTPDLQFEISGKGYAPEGSFRADGEEVDPQHEAGLSLLLRCGLLCNDASLRTRKEDGEPGIVGDPTEAALVVAAAKAGYDKDGEESSWPRVSEFPFTSERKRMTTVHRVPSEAEGPEIDAGGIVAFTKGAPDVVLERCSTKVQGGSATDLTDQDRRSILDQNNSMARQALRVLALAFKPLDEVPAEDAESTDVERDLVFAGLVGLIDPARPEATDAVARAAKAGIRTVMITGDYKETAAAIGREVGILADDGEVLSGPEIEELSDEDLRETAGTVNAYARVSPQHKVRILEALRARGHVVAMTGDGVNDAPALKRAEIGVAMGITGTDVAKQTSEMVLTDDNFASIVSAVEEGRIIYSNIRKFVYYLISCNIGEILIIFTAMVSGLAVPLTPLMILWLNLITDGAPALALSVEKGDPDIMQQDPRPPTEPIINGQMRIGLAVQATVMTVAVLASYILTINVLNESVQTARTIAFSTLVLSELVRAFTSRSETESIFRLGFTGNKWMLPAVGGSLILLLTTIYIPGLRVVFETVPLNIVQWLRLLPFTVLAATAAEITKFFLRRRATRTRSRNNQ